MKPDEERKTWFLWIRKMVLRVKDDKNNPIYMIRYSLFTCPLFAIKLHRIMLSDDDCMHDHPWTFISFILWGSYVEQTPDGRDTRYSVGSILWRPNPWPHRLVIEPGKSATTLVITFKKVREWGFYTSKGWQIWHSFIRQGRKCD